MTGSVEYLHVDMQLGVGSINIQVKQALVAFPIFVM